MGIKHNVAHQLFGRKSAHQSESISDQKVLYMDLKIITSNGTGIICPSLFSNKAVAKLSSSTWQACTKTWNTASNVPKGQSRVQHIARGCFSNLQVANKKHGSMCKVYNTSQMRSARRFAQLLIIGLCLPGIYTSMDTTALPMDLGYNNNGRTTFQLSDRTLDIVNSKRGVIAYTSKLETSRQVKSISKFIDYSSIGIANANVKGSLNLLSSQYQVANNDKFVLQNNIEYHVSDIKMDHNQCGLYCSKLQGTMITTSRDYLTMVGLFEFDQMWITSHSNITKEGNNLNYQLYLGTVQIYPVNRINEKDKPKLYYYHGNEKVPILNVNHKYTYYNGQAGLYWDKSPYNLWTTMNSSAHVEILLPENQLHHVSASYHNKCGCSRTPHQSTLLYNDLKANYANLMYQQTKNKFGIEPERTKSKHPEHATIDRLIYPFLNNEISSFSKDNQSEIFKMTDLHPLLGNITHERLASSILMFTARSVGRPIMVSLIQPQMKEIAKRLKGKLYKFAHIGGEFDNSFIDLSTLTLEENNVSLILKYGDLGNFKYNISGDMVRANKLLKSLTLANRHFADFLKNEVETLLMGMASNSIVDTIDESVPVVAIVHRSQSFLVVTFFFACYDQTYSVTSYEATALPHEVLDNEFVAIDVPKQFTSNMLSGGYEFPTAVSKVHIDECIDALLGSADVNIFNECGSSSFSDIRLQMLFEINAQRLVLARGIGSIVKIVCPNKKQELFKLTRDILIMLTSSNCNVIYSGAHGNIVLSALTTLDQSDQGSQTVMLLQYDLIYRYSTDNVQTYFIIGLLISLSIILFLVGVILYCVFTRKMTAEIHSNHSGSFHRVSDLNMSVISQNTGTIIESRV